MTEWYLIVGLGNPGPRYENTRHNIGWRALDRLASKHGLTFSKIEHRAQVASGTIHDKRVLLAKPLTFMNLSGDAVAPLARFYKIAPENIIIVHDDLDTPLGLLRVRKGGGHGGQNGVRHIQHRLGTQDIPRIRIGIGRPPGRMDAADYVLTPFRGDETIIAAEIADRAAAAIETWLAEGIDSAMNRYNGGSETTRDPQTKQPESASGSPGDTRPPTP